MQLPRYFDTLEKFSNYLGNDFDTSVMHWKIVSITVTDNCGTQENINSLGTF